MERPSREISKGAIRLVPDLKSRFMNGQNSVVIPSHTYGADHDPNMRKNRIPTENELSGLKGIANTLTKSIQDMEGDIKTAQEAYDLLLAKYQQQFRELEGTQSQLHESRELIVFLKKQCRSFKIKNHRLSGILHPIRRCPTDVLRCIFESACKNSDPEEPAHTAIRLSHVSQRWRMIAVETGRLWCDVTFSLRNPHLSEFWNTSIPRMRRVPATITLLDLDEAGGNRLKECNLQRIPVISTLVLDLIDPEYFGRIESLPRFLPKRGVEHLVIRHIPADDMLDETPLETWDIGGLLENIPPVTRLELCSPCELIITPSTKLATITWLDLKNRVNVDILATISLLPRLSRLYLDAVDITPSLDATQVVSNSLKRLQLAGIGETSWLSKLTCPNLDTFLIDQIDHWEVCMRFIKSHNSITSLDICSGVGSIAKLASIAPQVQVLEVDEDLSLLYKRKVPRLKGSPFPYLVQLIASTLDVAMTLEDFEGVIRARCLPRSHPLSNLTASLNPLNTLSIRRNQLKPVEEPWRDSELFQSAKKTTEQDPHWVSWDLLNLSWV